MKPIKLKTSKELNLNSSLLDYVTKNYGQQSLTQNLKSYFLDFNNNHNVISQNKNCLDSINDLNTTLLITTKYFNQIIAIKNKIPFSNGEKGCNIEFEWSDTITGNLFSSKNINFEYYNVLFNLASLYFYLGYKKSTSSNVDKNLRKESIKDYKYSLYLFNIIRDEALSKIDQNELPFDLYPSYCEYCSTLCIIYGQIEIVKIAEETNPNEYALRGKLLTGISDNYNKAYNLSLGDPTKKGGKDSYRNYLLNRSFYYKSLVYKKLAEMSLKKFDSTGLGYGEALVYQQLNMQQLTECQKTINLCENLVEVDKFNNLFNNEKKTETTLVDKNNRIYHQYTPDPNTIKLESKVLMVPLTIDNLYLKENEAKFRDDKIIYCEDLDLLAPSEVRPLIDKYKYKMNDFIQQYLNKYENENTIKNYINKLNLPQKITFKPADSNNPKSQIPPILWEKISQIQKLGGFTFLNNTMKKILNKSSELKNNLNQILSEIWKEENEDNYYRKKLGEQWVINPSNTLNKNFIQQAQNYINQINQSRQYDEREESHLNENSYMFQELLNSKNKIEQKIMQLSKVSPQLTPDEQKVRDEIIKLYLLSDKINDITNPILQEINSGNKVIPLFIDVLSNKMNENSVFELSKQKYIKQIQPLEEINNEIKNQEKIINDLVPSISENLMFPKENDETSKYLESLDKKADFYMEKLQKLRNGENFYIDKENKINKLIKIINDWLNQRKEEKKINLGTIRGHIATYDSNAAQNPFDNNSQTMEYYNRSDKSDYYSPNPNFNQNFQNDYYNQNSNFNPSQNMNNQNDKNNYYNSNFQFNQNQNMNQNNNYNQNSNIYQNQNNSYYNGNNNSQNNNNQNYKSYNFPPPGFNQINNFNDHFNPNNQSNNNMNFNMGNPFDQNQINNSSPFNNKRF